ncbi:putative pentatricopeptide repeat-containing protein At1g02420 [Dendrobium catenatum]|uniref:Pentatricopeptide repeat-containing protein n=1 Tax=Dendrobium catenatum TaxID=906689 RepID=A0A2I0XCW2_9ASPA|nr:putative pentatricopeptide repeat-containing protein At1g02420 [Dendrobium catenatum]PKU85745.1 Putative pentatricopeptide repeat-containing protein [Dendrobium catenatum]
MLHRLRYSSLRRTTALRTLPFRSFSSSSKSKEELSPKQHQQEEDAIFHIINSSSLSSMITSLKSLSIPLSNSIVDCVLKRVRFSHGNPLKALDFFKFTAKQHSFSHTPFSYDTMLYILGRGRRFPEMWNLLREMKQQDRNLITTRTIQIVLGRIAKVCSVRQTVESFRKFRRLAPEFNTDCFNALLRTLCQEKSMSDARNVYHSLKHEFRPNLQSFNILLSGWKSSEEAEGFFKEMAELGVNPDLVSYNCLIDVYCKNRELDKAYKVFDQIREKDFSPDVFTYTSIIGGLGLIGQPDKAKEVLKDMREMGCHPDAAAYNAVIRNYCIAKRLGNAFALMEEMESRGLKPNPTSYNLFFRCFYWANELESSWQLYKRMRTEGCLPNTQSCMFLVRMCRRQENVGLALELWNDMVKNGYGSLPLVSDVLFDLLCDLGKLDEAERCFIEMVEMGQKPSRVSFRRIKVLMELAKRQDCIKNLEEKMGGFGTMREADERLEKSFEMPYSEFLNL